jgi:hypothetical protein
MIGFVGATAAIKSTQQALMGKAKVLFLPPDMPPGVREIRQIKE